MATLLWNQGAQTPTNDDPRLQSKRTSDSGVVALIGNQPSLVEVDASGGKWHLNSNSRQLSNASSAMPLFLPNVSFLDVPGLPSTSNPANVIINPPCTDCTGSLSFLSQHGFSPHNTGVSPKILSGVSGCEARKLNAPTPAGSYRESFLELPAVSATERCHSDEIAMSNVALSEWHSVETEPWKREPADFKDGSDGGCRCCDSERLSWPVHAVPDFTIDERRVMGGNCTHAEAKPEIHQSPHIPKGSTNSPTFGIEGYHVIQESKRQSSTFCPLARCDTMIIPAETMESLRAYVRHFPDTILLSSSLTVETIRRYSNMLSLSCVDLQLSSSLDAGESASRKLRKGRRKANPCNSEGLRQKRKAKLTTGEEADHCHAMLEASRIFEPWTILKGIFSCPDHICDALYAHLVAFNYIHSVIAKTRPDVEPPSYHDSTSNNDGLRIPPKAASILGLSGRTVTSRRPEKCRSHSKPQTPAPSFTTFDTRVTDANHESLRAGLLRCIWRLIIIAGQLPEHARETIDLAQPGGVDSLLLQTLCEMVRQIEATEYRKKKFSLLE